jgi:type IV pilus assembly protein PilY1
MVSSKHVVFFGTGKYLESGDLTNQHIQTMYAIKDDGSAVTLVNPRSAPDMVGQTITNAGTTRTGSNNPVDFTVDRGWYADFPDVCTGSERENVNSQLIAGLVLVPTIVPCSTACSPGGYGWLTWFNYENGWVGGQRFDSPIVGFSIVFIKGTPIAEVVTAANPTPTLPPPPPFRLSTYNFQNQRSLWREF